jgi:hypothetical protein
MVVREASHDVPKAAAGAVAAVVVGLAVGLGPMSRPGWSEEAADPLTVVADWKSTILTRS